MQEARSSNPCTADYVCKKSDEKKDFHLQKPQIAQKFTAFTAFIAKRRVRFAVKSIFFHRNSNIFFRQNLYPGG